MNYSITTIPQREERANKLATELKSLGYREKIYMDKKMIGPWLAVRRVLVDIVKSGKPRMVLQDDVILGDQFARCQKELEQYLGEYGLISFFTPKPWDRKVEKYNCNADSTFLFWWAQGYMITPEFARMVIDVDLLLDQDLIGHIDEARITAAAGYNDVRLLIPYYCLIDHDLTVESSIGTHVEGFYARRMADENTDYNKLVPFINRDKPPYYYQILGNKLK